MLAPGSLASGEAVGLPAIVKHQRAGQALVSFGYVRNRSARTAEDGVAEVTGRHDLRRTQPRRLGKRVGDSSRS